MENPWLHLRIEPPFVLDGDKGAVDAFNGRLGDSQHKHYLRLNEILPEPFVGAKDAPILLLSNNPGIGGKSTPFRRADGFRAMMRNNLHHAETDWPFVFLDPACDEWETWWRRKRVGRLIKRFGRQTVARCILNVVLCPYPSQNYRSLSVPSQRYSFELVRNAVARNAVVILMRPGKQNEWETNVPELKGYSHFHSVPNPRNPAITENCPGYETVVAAIEAFTKNKQGEVSQ